MPRLKKVLVAALSLGALYSLVEPYWPRVRRRDCFLADLPPECEGMRVAHLSDLHAGALQPRAYLRRVVQLTNDQEPDLIAITGDFVSRRDSYFLFSGARRFARPVTEYAREIAEDLRPLQAKFGVWAVPGNHDLWNGQFSPISEILEGARLKILRNQNQILPNGLPLVGLDDLRGGRPNYRAALANITAHRAQLILSHNPRCAWQLGRRNALILSGHTHGGQIRLPFGVRKLPRDHDANFWLEGVYRLDCATLSLSVGVGCVGFPVRFLTRPEITIWTLRTAVF